jgi:hypothetical protein
MSGLSAPLRFDERTGETSETGDALDMTISEPNASTTKATAELILHGAYIKNLSLAGSAVHAVRRESGT